MCLETQCPGSATEICGLKPSVQDKNARKRVAWKPVFRIKMETGIMWLGTQCSG